MHGFMEEKILPEEHSEHESTHECIFSHGQIAGSAFNILHRIQATYSFHDLPDVTAHRERITITLDIFMNLVNTKH